MRVSAWGWEGEEGAEMLSAPEGRFHLDWGGFQYFMKAVFVKTTRQRPHRLSLYTRYGASASGIVSKGGALFTHR